MTVTYTHTHGIIASLPAGNELARHAADAYGHTLNTPERVNRPHGARDFAQAIRDAYGMAEPRNAAIVEYLESLEPETPDTPAPWVVDECPDASGNLTIREDDGTPNGDTETCIATAYESANARLIAAAPDMLAALNAFPDFPDDWDIYNADAVEAFAEAVTLWKEQAARATA